MNSDGTTSSVPTPTIMLFNEYIFKIQVYSSYPTVADLTDLFVWKNGIGIVGGVTDPPLVETLDVDINTDPWADKSLGKISVLVNTHGIDLITDVGLSEQKQYKNEIKADNGTNIITVMLAPIMCKNTVYRA